MGDRKCHNYVHHVPHIIHISSCMSAEDRYNQMVGVRVHEWPVEGSTSTKEICSKIFNKSDTIGNITAYLSSLSPKDNRIEAARIQLHNSEGMVLSPQLTLAGANIAENDMLYRTILPVGSVVGSAVGKPAKTSQRNGKGWYPPNMKCIQTELTK